MMGIVEGSAPDARIEARKTKRIKITRKRNGASDNKVRRLLIAQYRLADSLFSRGVTDGMYSKMCMPNILCQ